MRKETQHTTVDDNPAEDGTVPANPLCGAMGYNVCSKLKGADEVA